MADYRDPKVTKTRDKRGMGTWIGVLVAAVLVIGLIWWWAGGDYETAAVVQPVEPVEPAAEGTVEGGATEAQPTAPAPAEEGTETQTVPVTPPQD